MTAKMMLSPAAVFAFVLSTLLGCQPVSEVQGIDVPVMEQGYAARTYHLDRQGTRQVSFKVDLPYLSTEAYEYYISLFRKNGWIVCGEPGSWERHSYLGSEKERKDVKRILTHMWSDPRRVLVLISVEIDRSTGRKGVSHSELATQSVRVVQYENVNMEDLSSMMGLKCE